MGALNNSEPREPGTDYTGISSPGAGVLLEFRPIPFFGVEFGALYLPRKFSSSVAIPLPAQFTYDGKIYEFPLVLRMHLGRTLSFGVGGYYAIAKGEIGVASEVNGIKGSNKLTYADARQTTSDFGAVTSLALRFRLLPLIYLLIDGRYTIGMKNNSTVAGGDRKYNDMQLLAGLQLGF